MDYYNIAFATGNLDFLQPKFTCSTYPFAVLHFAEFIPAEFVNILISLLSLCLHRIIEQQNVLS